MLLPPLAASSLSIYLSDDVCKKSNTEELHFVITDQKRDIHGYALE
jgi:hypothetical protein